MKKSLGAKILVYPTPAWVVATYDQSGKANAMTVAWAGVCCSDPPAIAISIRETTHTYQAIVERKAFSINVPSEKYVTEVDFMGIASGKNTDKFSLTGLTPIKCKSVDAPFIDEFPLVIECSLLHTIKIGLHTQFIGNIVDVRAEEGVLTSSGVPDMKKLNPVIFGNGSYYGVGSHLGNAFSIGRNLAPPF